MHKLKRFQNCLMLSKLFDALVESSTKQVGISSKPGKVPSTKTTVSFCHIVEKFHIRKFSNGFLSIQPYLAQYAFCNYICSETRTKLMKA